MKKLILLFTGMVLTICVNAQLKVGQTLPAIKLEDILNAPAKTANLDDLRGKVIWLEFWATWCSPCVEAMPHLQALQKQFGNKLQVIAISTEKEKRIRDFIINKPADFWFDADIADKFREYFAYHTIPHAVLIDKTGKIVAITEPGNITAKVITDVIEGNPVDLPLKEDNMEQDPLKTYFAADAGVKKRFLVQPGIKGLGSSSHSYNNDSVFKDRRLTMINLSLEGIYRIAYNGLPYGRTIDLTPKENIKQNKTLYCMDIIVPKGHEDELRLTLRKELQGKFDLNATVEKRLKEVYVLKVADTNKVKQLKPTADKKETFAGSHGVFSGQDVKLSKIADYLESFGLVNLPVIDETGSNLYYDISFDYQPEKEGSLMAAIAGLGLKLEKGQREIDMLVFK